MNYLFAGILIPSEVALGPVHGQHLDRAAIHWANHRPWAGSPDWPNTRLATLLIVRDPI